MENDSKTVDLYGMLSTDDARLRSVFAAAIIAGLVGSSLLGDGIQIAHLFFLILCILFIWVTWAGQNDAISSKESELEQHLRLVDPADEYQYLYVDGNIVEFFYEILSFKEEAETTYTECLLLANEYLRVVDDVQSGVLVRPLNNIKNGEEIGKELLEKYESFVFSLDMSNPPVVTKYSDAKERLKVLINRLNLLMRAQVTKEEAFGGTNEGVLNQFDDYEAVDPSIFEMGELGSIGLA